MLSLINKLAFSNKVLHISAGHLFVFLGEMSAQSLTLLNRVTRLFTIDLSSLYLCRYYSIPWDTLAGEEIWLSGRVCACGPWKRVKQWRKERQLCESCLPCCALLFWWEEAFDFNVSSLSIVGFAVCILEITSRLLLSEFWKSLPGQSQGVLSLQAQVLRLNLQYTLNCTRLFW